MAWDIVQKIRAMVAKAEDKATGPAEAEVIMQKVRQMLDKHGISLLTITDTISNDPVDASKNVAHFWASENWVRALSDAAGLYYGVRVVWTRGAGQNKTHISVVGRESCRAAFSLMLPYFVRAVKRQAKIAVAEGAYPSKSAAETRIGHALTERLTDLYWDREIATRETATEKEKAGIDALVPVDELDLAMAEAFPRVRAATLKSKTQLTTDARRRAGEIGVSDQVARAEDPTRQLK